MHSKDTRAFLKSFNHGLEDMEVQLSTSNGSCWFVLTILLRKEGPTSPHAFPHFWACIPFINQTIEPCHPKTKEMCAPNKLSKVLIKRTVGTKGSRYLAWPIDLPT